MIRAETVEARVVDFQTSRNCRATPHKAPAWQEISHLEKQYPDFRAWYFGKVIPGIIRGDRCVLTSAYKERLVGLAIAKRGDEKKLCTLWVDSDARRLGIASDLADRAFDWIGTDHPLFTVPEEHLQKFGGLLSRWEFTQTAKIFGYYRAGKVEYVFNGKLEPNYSS
jgi:GNAT superfamily N-acetyltransferase